MSGYRNTQTHSWTPLWILASALLLVYLLWKVMIIFILAALFAFLIFPLVKLMDRRLPRALSIVTVYLLIIIVLTSVIGQLVPIITSQFNHFVTDLPSIWTRVSGLSHGLDARFGTLPPSWRDLGRKAFLELQRSGIQIARQGFSMAILFFSSLLTLVFIPLLTFFMLLGYPGYKTMLTAIMPRPYQGVVDDLLFCMGRVLRSFFRGEFLLIAAVGLADTIGLFAIRMPYAIILGVIGGTLELIPSLGPTLATILIVLTGLAQSPVMALKAAAIALSIQILENVFLVPVVMGKTVDLDPITLSFAIFLGGTYAGIPGAIISVPIAMIIKVYIIYFYVDRTILPPAQVLTCTPSAPVKRRRSRRT